MRPEAAEGVQAFISDLTGSQPGAAMTVAQEAGDEVMVRQVANTWASRDLNGYVLWVAAQVEGEDRDWASSVVIRQFQRQRSFEEAMEWSASASEPRLRARTMCESFYGWFNYDRAAALDWLKQASIPDEVREALKPYAQQ